MARDIDRKLRLSAALLGTVTRKELAAAFRKINADTSFDIGRADKWLQGRARPRERAIYDDWVKVLDLPRTGRWLADCEIQAFVDELCSRHGCDPDELQRRTEESGSPASRQAPGLTLAGTYVCYSHAWSPYFRGRLVRGELSITSATGPNRLTASYVEALPTGLMELEGTVTLSKHDLRLDVSDPTGSAQLLSFCLFPPSPPASVLGGLMLGTTLIGPDAQPSVSRVAMARLPAPSPRLRTMDAYLPTQGSIAEDLTSLGLTVQDGAAVDRHMDEFIRSSGDGSDQVPVAAYRALVGLFDRAWLYGASATA